MIGLTITCILYRKTQNMKSKLISITTISTAFSFMLSCTLDLPSRTSCHEEMIGILKHLEKQSFGSKNPFHSEAKLPYMDSLLNLPHSTPGEIRYCNYLKANILLELGREKEAIRILERLVKEENKYGLPRIKKDLAMAYLRQGERANCISNHAAESCILPIQGFGVHQDSEGSKKAIALYVDIIKGDPYDIESKWLLNIAYMTLGQYPKNVPAAFFIPDMEGDTSYKVKASQRISITMATWILYCHAGDWGRICIILETMQTEHLVTSQTRPD